MNFQSLIKIDSAEKLLDNALRQSSKKAMDERGKKSKASRLVKSRKIELVRVDTFGNYIANIFENIVKSYPDFDELADFYKELCKATLNVDLLRKSLGAVNWAKRQIQQLHSMTQRKLKQKKELADFNGIRTAFFGRVCSIVKQIDSNLQFLESCRKTMKRFPALKTSYFTVVIAGAPNVGKSTLLAALTGSKPEIAYYPFTTKNLNFGTDKAHKIQYVDTPGLLDRPLKERNKIELQAIIALKNIADVIIFVFDPTGACGYSIEAQKNLLEEIESKFKVPVIKVANKVDVGSSSLDALPVSAKEKINVAELKALVLARRSSI